MPNYLSDYDSNELPSFGECVKFHEGRVLFTPVGIRRYGERFARAGFDISLIETAEDLQRALEGSWHVELDCLREALSGRPVPTGIAPLERRFLLARRSGAEDEAARILQVAERRASLRLVAEEGMPSDSAPTGSESVRDTSRGRSTGIEDT